jgi:prepilin-type N-terminal cleavage/methylation domain-containing protein|tara:strand:- start:344 stop:886 length:543 start_codon:yes stop_codon:yes gene_type:complete
MSFSPRRQAGFTLIEITVVVVILATMSGMSLFAINQAFDRRYQSQAENLLVWLNQLSEQAALEGVAYGIVGDAEDPQQGEKLQPVAYFRQHWFVTSYPEAFELDNEARAEWVITYSNQYDDIEDPLVDDDDALVPIVAMLPDGYMEPSGELLLSFDSSPLTYSYSWDEESGAMTMLKSAP